MRNRLQDWSRKIAWFEILKYMLLVGCFMAAETIFRAQPVIRVRYVGLMDEVPFMFDFFYSVIFVIIIASISKNHKKLKRLCYGILYAFWCIFMLSQYIYCRIFDRIYGIHTLRYAGDGGDFATVVLSYFDSATCLLIGGFLLFGILGWFCIPEFPLAVSKKIERIIELSVIVVSTIAIVMIPSMFKEPPKTGGGVYRFKKVIYEDWIDNKRAVTMFGTYEFLFRDIYMTLNPKPVSEEDITTVTEYFAGKQSESNEMTDIFKGKNLILVLMESMDDWLINEETTPTICSLMDEGINFTNMYTPIYGSSATLGSEICSYTGLYAPADGTPLVNYTNNTYSYSLPNLFRKEGYTAKSFHYNSGEYYNRQNIHNSMGFEEYVSFMNYDKLMVM